MTVSMRGNTGKWWHAFTFQRKGKKRVVFTFKTLSASPWFVILFCCKQSYCIFYQILWLLKWHWFWQTVLSCTELSQDVTLDPIHCVAVGTVLPHLPEKNMPFPTKVVPMGEKQRCWIIILPCLIFCTSSVVNILSILVRATPCIMKRIWRFEWRLSSKVHQT